MCTTVGGGTRVTWLKRLAEARRTRAQIRRIQNEKAIIIQKVCKQYIHRIRLENRKRRAILEKVERAKAALTIQRTIRGWRSRKSIVRKLRFCPKVVPHKESIHKAILYYGGLVCAHILDEEEDITLDQLIAMIASDT